MRYLFYCLLLTAYCLLFPVSSHALSVGDTVTGMEFTAGNGSKVTFNDYKGKVLFINFWVSWCEPCKKEMPELTKLSGRYKDQGLVLLSVNCDRREAMAKNFLEENQVNMDVFFDSKGKALEMFNVLAMPMSFVVDKKGTVRFVHFGFNDRKDPEHWEKEIQGLLNEQ